LTKDELIRYWLLASDKDFRTMQNLFKSKDYHWSLFIGHLVLEKLLKAYFVKHKDQNVPLIHDLFRIAEKADLNLTEEQKDFLDEVTRFNISARYPDYKHKFYKKCTLKFTEKKIEKIKEFRSWLKRQIRKQSTK